MIGAGSRWLARVVVVSLLLARGDAGRSAPARGAPVAPSTSTDAQRLFIKSYGQDAGLPAAQVFVGYQDSRSYLWFGTPAGLARYNGDRFRVYTVDDGLLHDAVRSVTEHQGAIWLTGEKGVTQIDLEGKRQATYSTKDGLGAGIVWRVVRHKGQLWFGTSSGGISRLVDGGRFETFTSNDGLPGNNVFALLSDGRWLWIGTRGGGLGRYDSRTKRFEVVEGLPAKHVMALAKVGRTLWVGTRDAGIFSRGPGGTFVQRLADAKVYSVGVRRDELFWGTLGQGVVRMNTTAEGTQARYTKDNGLAGDRVYSVLVDREDSIWFTTNAGVSKLLSDKFVSYMPGSNILAVEEFRNAIWLGTLGQGLKRLPLLAGAQPRIAEQLAGQNVWSLRVFDKRLWIGTADGLHSFDGERMVQHALVGAPQFDGLYDLAVVRNRLWLATTGGVCVYDHQAERCTPYTVKDGLAGNVNYSGTAHGGRACFGAEGGVSCIDHRRVQIYREGDGLPSSTVYVVFTDAEGRLWAGTNRGLAVLEGKRFRAYDRNDGLSHNLVTALAELEGRLLVCTNGGLNLFKEERVLQVYKQKSGMISNEVNFSSILVDSQQSVWMGTTRGVAKYIPKKDLPNSHAPQVWIEECLVNGAAVGALNTKGPPMRLTHDRRNVSFRYAGLSFKDEENVAYSYQLQGFDRGWSPPASARSVRYTNLAPGPYTFRVRARNADGYWSKRPAKVGFVVLPPFWRTWWFIGLCGLVLVVLVYLGVRLRLRKMQRDYLRLEAVVEERTQQLRQAAERLKDLSLTDPLTGLRNRRFLREIIDAEVAHVRRQHNDLIRAGGPSLEKAYLGFILLDLDHFKEINDTYGHEAGDMLIKTFARRLQQTVRGEDAVIRWGGEEFLVVCREVSPESLLQLCERVLERLRAEPIKVTGGEEVQRTCTAGFSVYPFVPGDPDLFNHETVINFADHALYVGKRNGRDLALGLVGEDKPLDAKARDWVRRDIARGVEEGYLRLLAPKGRELSLK